MYIYLTQDDINLLNYGESVVEKPAYLIKQQRKSIIMCALRASEIWVLNELDIPEIDRSTFRQKKKKIKVIPDFVRIGALK